MKAIDVHSHFSTQKGYVFRTPEEVAAAEKHYRYKAVFKTEEEMAQDFRDADVKPILDAWLPRTLDEAKEMHEYVAEVLRKFPDVYLGAWSYINPHTGLAGVKELERCITSLGFVGGIVHAVEAGIRCNDKLYYPFYELCAALKAPVLITVGMTGQGAGLPGGQGLHLKYAHPMDVDDVAADFPDLTVIAAHPAWPWQDEMIAVLLHKANVFNDLHGWSPKYFTPELKKEINGRLQDRFMFGSDYPTFTFERLFRDWESEGYKPEVLEKVYWKNAQRIFGFDIE